MYREHVEYVDASRYGRLPPPRAVPRYRTRGVPVRRTASMPRVPGEAVEVVHRYHISADPDISDDVLQQAASQFISRHDDERVKVVIEKLDGMGLGEEEEEEEEEEYEEELAQPQAEKKRVQFGVEQIKYYRPPEPEPRSGPITVTVKVPPKPTPAVVQHQHTPQQQQYNQQHLQYEQVLQYEQAAATQQQQQQVYAAYPSAEQILQYYTPGSRVVSGGGGGGGTEPIQVAQVLQYQPPVVHGNPQLHNMFSQIAQITEHLYLSGCHALSHAKLRQLGITCIVNATKEIGDVNLPEIHTIRVLVNDVPSASLSGYFDKVADKVEAVRKAGGRVLIHCVAGVSRSASLVIAYLMKHGRMSLLEAYTHVKTRRAVIRPNVGFFKQLIAYEKKLFGKNSVKMVASSMGQIPDVYQEEYKNMVHFNPKR